MPSAGATWSPARAVITGGLVVGVLDIGEVIVVAWLRSSQPLSLAGWTQRIGQSVASGWYGRDAAFSGGWGTGAAGLLTHFFIAMMVVVVFYAASRRMPWLLKRPVPTGMAYGMVVFAVMNLVVIPLSAIGHLQQFSTFSFFNQIFCHLFCIGTPAGWFVSRAGLPGAVAVSQAAA